MNKLMQAGRSYTYHNQTMITVQRKPGRISPPRMTKVMKG